MKETLKKFLYFFLLCFSILGSIGAAGWVIYQKAWAILIGALVIDYAAFPKVREWFHKLLS